MIKHLFVCVSSFLTLRWLRLTQQSETRGTQAREICARGRHSDRIIRQKLTQSIQKCQVSKLLARHPWILEGMFKLGPWYADSEKNEEVKMHSPRPDPASWLRILRCWLSRLLACPPSGCCCCTCASWTSPFSSATCTANVVLYTLIWSRSEFALANAEANWAFSFSRLAIRRRCSAASCFWHWSSCLSASLLAAACNKHTPLYPFRLQHRQS